ncbi:phage major capsid protein [Liquorilactobacillus capillatus]|uniref:HK97 family phage major capsid protein n=1 Tax=Liquorilactobacillus capillatus DSM 19910 TaxID=1423731 RepID=A0A0R1M3C3_9LACO|nr:phage major capsid protein [Liquorilactobacillus capillatus]KRL02518.1 HK97 family phage major capsid protein [Liquorilactobacillus capillatus DSM 19910]
MFNVNQINDAWIASGQKVADLNAKLNAAVLDDSFDKKTFENLKNDRDNEMAHRDALKGQLDQARAEAETNIGDDNKVTVVSDKNGHKAFAKGIRDLLRGKVKHLNLVSTSSDTSSTSGAGLTIPPDIQTRINTLIRQYDQLQSLVNVEKTSVEKGTRNVEVFSTMNELVELDDEDADIGDNDEPKLKPVSYEIKRYAGINKITNTLLKDSDENIINWIVTWIAKKVVVTRNKKIILVLNTAPKKPTIAKWDDIIDLSDGALDPAISNIGVFLTNQSGWVTIKKVKDAMGNYLIQRDPQGSVPKVINDKQVVVVSDNWLPDTANNVHPLYFGSFKEGVTLFDRENMSLAQTTEGGTSFQKDQTWIRVIDRFDVESVDEGAFAAGSFSSVADQKANFTASAAANNG